jgi:hypothetical protein
VRTSSLYLAALVAAICACASKPTPVTVTGDPEDRASLAGKWSGDYNSPATGRSGSIVFNLSRSGDAASGDVVMIPKGYGKPLVPYERSGTGVQSPGTSSQVLTIRMVRVAGGIVNGVLDPYRDPECNCAVQTSFTGSLSGDTIEGTFTTSRPEASTPQTGTWRVKRGR